MSNPAPAGRRYGGVSQEERRAQRRQALVDAGTALFGSIGFRATTVRAVCQAAQLNDRYFYAEFFGLEGLLLQVYRHWVDQLVATMKPSMEGAGPVEERIDAGLHAYFRFMRDPLVARILLLEVLGVSPAVDEAYAAGLAQFGKLMATSGAGPWTEAGLDKADQRITSTVLVGGITSAATYWLLTNYTDPEARMVRNCRLVLLGTVAREGQAGPARKAPSPRKPRNRATVPGRSGTA